jgi:hypothetical protein
MERGDMSHVATSWLAALDPSLISASEFRVLFHLCDCHNPSKGCFPSQEYLRAHAAVSNGTVNNALKSLEEKGFLKRQKRFDHQSKRQLSTHYILGFEIETAQEPTPKIGDGADSKKWPIPSPKNGRSRLQQIGDEPVKEPVKKNARANATPKGAPSKQAVYWAEKINDPNVPVVSNAVVGPRLAAEMLHFELVDEKTLRERGLVY